jgi:hypothetical protein
MSTSPVYDRPYTPVEYDCKCGVKYRIDFESYNGPCAGQSFQHCTMDDARILGGPILRVWEERNGKWILTEQY